MAENFRIGETKRTTTGEIEVETKPASPLGIPPGPILTALLQLITLNPGPHTFQLVVEDQNGNLSAPARVVVDVFKGQFIFDPQ